MGEEGDTGINPPAVMGLLKVTTYLCAIIVLLMICCCNPFALRMF
jgi:hypothetical protein